MYDVVNYAAGRPPRERIHGDKMVDSSSEIELNEARGAMDRRGEGSGTDALAVCTKPKSELKNQPGTPSDTGILREREKQVGCPVNRKT